MSASPFLTLRVRRRTEILRLRCLARRVAGLLRFEAHEQACIAAGSFLVACTAVERLGSVQVCFQLEQNQLHIFAQGIGDESDQPSASPPRKQRPGPKQPQTDPLPRLIKDLPSEQALQETDVAWLAQSLTQMVPGALFDEIVHQNREILALLHELRSCQGRLQQQAKNPKQEDNPNNPSAA